MPSGHRHPPPGVSGAGGLGPTGRSRRGAAGRRAGGARGRRRSAWLSACPLGGRVSSRHRPVPRRVVADTVAVRGGTDGRHPAAGLAPTGQPRRPDPPAVGLEALDQRRTEALIDDPAGISSGQPDAGRRTSQRACCGSALQYRRRRRAGRHDAGRAGLPGHPAGRLGRRVGPGGHRRQPRAGARARSARGSIEEPRYEGLLVNAPAVIGDARRIADHYEPYRDQLQQMVGNVSKLYTHGLHAAGVRAGRRAPCGCCTSPTCTSTRPAGG